jgi:signal transduction histidine kinase/ActR/RegA family two-component response regulator
MTTLDIRPPEHIPALLEHLARAGHGIEKSGAWKHRKRSGEIIEVETTSHSLVFGGRDARLVMAEDVTERQRAQKTLREREEQLRHAQKMDAVRSLARGIAHDFNNQMAIVTGYCDLLLRQLGEDESARKKVQEIRDAASRAAVLTRQLLTFSQRQIAQPVVMNPNTLVAGMEEMLRPWIGDHIEIKTARQPEVGLVKADPNQLAQVLMTLAINARDAMPQGGEIAIETSQGRLGAGAAAVSPEARPGDYVLISMRDTGQGMDAEMVANIFEPFYSTKEMGTGLGLYTAHNIIKEAGGYIWVHSQPRQGTTFEIYLPREAEAATEKGDSATTQAEVAGGSETILVVEDKPRLLRMTSEMLEVLGYRVLEAASGQAAIEHCERHDGPIHLLLTDVSMPRMSGQQLAKRLESLRPETKLLYMSGHAGPTADDTKTGHGSAPYLAKPFTLATLARQLREALDK